MRMVEAPEVFFASGPALEWNEIMRYLKKVEVRTQTPTSDWLLRTIDKGTMSEGEDLVEFGGRFCYRSWTPEANANVTRVRENPVEYHANILRSGHGSVLEHANYSFIFDDVSRVFTHEMVRHRAGVAVSQESMRYVRLTDLPFWFPEWARKDEVLMEKCMNLLHHIEDHQLWMSAHFGLDEEGADFSDKKHKTSFMRRFAPDGVATGMLATINIRALRHIIHMRTALAAEEEIRIVFDQVADICKRKFPNLMQDYTPNEHQEWIPDWLKV